MKIPLLHTNSLVLAASLCGASAAMPGESLASARLTAPFLQADGPVKGRVVDDKGMGLPGVNVVVKGSTTGTQTDADGQYSLDAPANAVLVFSFVGSTAQEIAVGGRSTVNVTLQPDTKALGEVVVVGYGTQRRADLTSSVASVKEENFIKGATKDAGQLLQGKVAGLTVSTPSGDPTANSQILLRGTATLNSSTQPLVLIDGIPGTLNTVAPEDIESIDVLKDGSAAAIYGTRGTNGVILITTRRPKGNITPTIEYSGYVSTQRIARRPEMLTASEYRQKLADGVAFTDQGASTDWIKAISQDPLIHVHNLTFKGGNGQTNYLINGNYRYFEGIFQKSDNRTFTGRADVNHTMFDGRVKINLGILNSNNRFTTTADGGSFNGYTYRQAVIRNPTAPIYNENGTYAQQLSLFNYENPLSRLYNSDGENTSQNTRLNGSIVWEPIDNLQLKALASNTRYNQVRGYSEDKQHPSTLRDGLNGYASRGTTQVIDKLAELTATYNRSFGEHRFSALAGYSYQQNTAENYYMQNWDFPTDLFTYNNIGIGNAVRLGRAPIYSDKGRWNLVGFFGRVTYNYKEKYLLLASVRREASSRFLGAKQPWGTFPAVSVGWRLNQENFLQGASFIDDLKLRAGYGVTGTAPDASFLGVARLGYTGFFLSNGTWVQTLSPVSNPNPSLRWEEKHETNVGLDYSFLKGRISGTVDYYIRRTNGLLYNYQVPSPPNLFTTTTANVGSMENKGIEVLLNLIPAQTKNFVWNSSFNFSNNQNKLVSLTNDLYTLTNNFFTTGYTGEPIQTYTHRVEVGKRLGDFYGYKVVDVTDDGQWIYETKDGERLPYNQFTHSEDDKQVLGNGLPKYYAGWNNNFQYKQFDLGITMRGAFGYQILNFQRMYYENTGVTQYNRLRSAYDRVFDKAVLSTSMPLEYNSYYVENGSFWKVDNITLGYNFKPNPVKYIKNMRVYVSTLNTFTITGYSGIDPEVNRIGLAPGNDDRDKYPTVRTFTLGANLTF
ncbi:TonB-dependent receptor [Hymenobacter aerilatus]|uniref:TonB-dependent receptor n=1 Tax=Hymenobacter aerilatus TaxID=2932251 RepID=A0A8T9T5N4_9BACT|nr:TonB-dependent receptor [Hymenobacter aerilatus]UOR07396.1 TonB-dependent receptor [Hymenobacter aerilatus]